jgi:alpha-tubulin suppressor-like RCC1 family protein
LTANQLGDYLSTSTRLWAFGLGTSGQLGDNTILSKSSPIQTTAFGTNWKQISVSMNNLTTTAIKSDGTLWSWGLGTTGQLGDNTILSKSSPVQTVAGGTTWLQSASGFAHTVAVKSDGTLWTWGSNATYGQLGDNTVAPKSSPVQTVAFGTNWKNVSCGGYHCAATKTDGTLWGWGLGTLGQLGDNTILSKSSPVQTVAGGTNWLQVSCGYYHTAAIKTDGTLWTWGDNTSGKLGDNTASHKSSPIQTVAFGTNWKQVSSGSYNMAAIKTDGTLWTWGQGPNGNLGDNTAVSKSSPVQTVTFDTTWKQVSAGTGHMIGTKTDNTMWSWGLGTSGQLGDNTIVTKSSPVQTVTYGLKWKQAYAGNQVTYAIQTEADINLLDQLAASGGGITVTDDTSTNATRYLTFTSATSGSISTENVSSTKLTFNPSTGDLTVGGNVTANSDLNLKEDIVTIPDALQKVRDMRGVSFSWKENGRKSIGVVAQEVEKVLPELVNETDGVKSVAYGNIIGLLIEAIKEQDKRIDDLERRL